MAGTHRNIKNKIKIGVKYGKVHPGKRFPIGVSEFLLETGTPNRIRLETGDRLLLEG